MVSFTPDQERAIQIDQHIAVEAGAGAGKTTVLVHRYLEILQSSPKITPSKILTITFTRKAAGELTERIHHAIHALPCDTLEERIKIQNWKIRLGNAQIGTIHSFCAQILRRSGHLIGIDPQFQLIEDGQVRAIWHAIANEWISLGIRRNEPALIRLISTRSHTMIMESLTTLFHKWDTLDSGSPITDAPSEESQQITDMLFCFNDILMAYRQHIRQQGSLDFGHLQYYAQQLLIHFPAIADQLAIDYPYIMIDEFQDTDTTQWDIIQRISTFSSSPRCNIFVVGDIKQAIYGFRGSDTTLFQSILDDFSQREDATVVHLTDNFRSTDPLIQFYNHLFSTLFRPDAKIPVHYTPLRSHRISDTHSIELSFPSSKSEDFSAVYDWIINRHNDGLGWDDIAIICRRNAPLIAIATYLKSKNIPHVLMSNYHPLRTPECQYLILLLRYLIDPLHPHYSIEIQTTPWTLSELTSLVADCQQNGLLPVIGPWISQHTDPSTQSAWAIIYPMLKQAPSVPEGLRHIESELRQAKGKSGNRSISQQLKLMTIHSSKGLEFSAVAIIGCGDRLSPPANSPVTIGPDRRIALTSIDGEASEWKTHLTTQNKELGIEEEKRTFYVACTRAKDHLLLSGKYDPTRPVPDTPGCYFDFLGSHITTLPSGVSRNTSIEIAPSTPVEAPNTEDDPVSIHPPITSGLATVSVSQLLRWRACVRQYELSRVLSGFESHDTAQSLPEHTGILVHRCLEQLIKNPSLDLPNLVNTTAHDLGLVEAIPNTLHHLSVTTQSKAFQVLLTQSPTTEFGFQLRIDQLLVSGRIDCLSQRHNQWIITDFKTDASPTEAHLPSHHYDQLMIYALAIATAKRCEDPIEMQVIYTKTGQTVSATCTHEDRTAFLQHLHQIPANPFKAPEASVCNRCPISQWIPNCATII